MPYGGFPYPYARRPSSVGPRKIAGFVVGLVGAILLLLALLGPWWSIKLSVSSGLFSFSVGIDFGVFAPTVVVTGFPLGTVPTYAQMPAVAAVFQIVVILVGVGAILAFNGLILGLFARGPGLRWAALALMVAAVALTVLAPLYAMLALPGATGLDQLFGSPGGTFPPLAGFWGSRSLDLGIGATLQMSWGAGWGWYVPFVGASLVLVGGILSASAHPRAAAAFMVPAPAPAAPWAWPMQPPAGPVAPPSPESPPSPPPAASPPPGP
jgi:hypothetical protein